ncbi:hypothetical protein [Trichloromonas acetexigens]|uniref:Uncharacterized protein n=1 Tax=Trichloromonas acetexigens TaxID=38815 RepID=A0A550JH75_9BACT|nr:hypothetical protein [Desulfuromonas acetexigens]TRO82577.1 hypothetical protein FL622_05145 [Desulfuromonas acetexigens]
MDTNNKTISVIEFGSVFEKICNFIAVSKTGDAKSTIKGLILLSLSQETVSFRKAEDFQASIEKNYGLEIPRLQIEDAIGELESEGKVSCPSGTNYRLDKDVERQLLADISHVSLLEGKVKSEWFEELQIKATNLDLETSWRALKVYLSKTFRRHGIQAAALLDPNIDTEPGLDVSLTTLLRKSVQENFSKENHQEAYRIITDFMASVGINKDRSKFITQLADAAFNFFTLEVPQELAKTLREQLSELVLFLDTNFLFGILDLHYNTQVEVSHDLIRAITTNSFPFKLSFHERTGREMINTIDHFGRTLRTRAWTRSLSRAASMTRNLSGIEQKFHEKNMSNVIDVDEFLRPYEHFDELLREKNIHVYHPGEEPQQAHSDLYHEYREYLDNRGRGDKSYETVMHDAVLLEAARRLRTDSTSSLKAGALIISCDYYLYRFDWESSRRNRQRACVLLPNIFWQILRPFISKDQDFEKAFAETFALPEFRILGSGGTKACSKMLSILATYKDVPEKTAIKLLSNDLLLDKLRATNTDEQFTEHVEMAFVEENRTLIEEKAALAKQLEEEKSRRERETQAREQQKEKFIEEQHILGSRLDEIKGDLEVAMRAAAEHRVAADEAARRAQEAQRLANEAALEANRLNSDIQGVQTVAQKMSIVAGFALGALLIFIFEGLSHMVPWAWLVNHKNTLPLQIGISLMLLFMTLGITVKPWRKWCYGVACFGFFLTVLPLMGN